MCSLHRLLMRIPCWAQGLAHGGVHALDSPFSSQKISLLLFLNRMLTVIQTCIFPYLILSSWNRILCWTSQSCDDLLSGSSLTTFCRLVLVFKIAHKRFQLLRKIPISFFHKYFKKFPHLLSDSVQAELLSKTCLCSHFVSVCVCVFARRYFQIVQLNSNLTSLEETSVHYVDTNSMLSAFIHQVLI